MARLGWLSRQAKLPLHVGWHRTRQICRRPSNVKSTIRKARSSPTQTWIALGKNGRYLQLRRFTFFALDTWSLLRTVLNSASWLCQSGDSDAAACCYRDVGPKGPNNKHRLEEHLWHVGSTTSTVASLRVARLGWLPSQANLPLHDGWHRNWQMCHWPWNVKSTMVATYNFAASPFLHYMISTQDHLRPC